MIWSSSKPGSRLTASSAAEEACSQGRKIFQYLYSPFLTSSSGEGSHVAGLPLAILPPYSVRDYLVNGRVRQTECEIITNLEQGERGLEQSTKLGRQLVKGPGVLRLNLLQGRVRTGSKDREMPHSSLKSPTKSCSS